MVSVIALARFKELYYHKYNIFLDDEQALEHALCFLNLMKILIKPNKVSR